MGKLLVTGGCGYIGSHTIVDLLEQGYEIINVDNLYNSEIDVLKGIKKITGKDVTHYTVDLCDKIATRKIFEAHPDIEGVIHFAAYKSVGDSVNQPIEYFDNNLNSLLNVLDNSRQFNVKYFVFSSSCTVYGAADILPVTEQTPIKPAESPYGRTKQIGEFMLEDAVYGTSIKALALRYFNPAGAHASGLIGESPSNIPQNLVPVITETAIGKRESLTVFGGDYNTLDGSCIRDFIHVSDLANAHTAAFKYLQTGTQTQSFDVFNLGIGKGISVLEAIHSFEKVTGIKLNYKIGEKRPGDIVEIFADTTKVNKLLNWRNQYGIDDIMKTAWAWEQKRSISKVGEKS